MGKNELYINQRALTKDIINHKFKDQVFEQDQKLRFTQILLCIWPYSLGFFYHISIILPVHNFV